MGLKDWFSKRRSRSSSDTAPESEAEPARAREPTEAELKKARWLAQQLADQVQLLHPLAAEHVEITYEVWRFPLQTGVQLFYAITD